MIYRIIFYLGNEITELELSSGQEKTVGSGESDTLRIKRRGLTSSHLRLSFTEAGIHASSAVPMRVGGENSSNRVLPAGETAALSEGLYMSVCEKRCDFSAAISLHCRAGERVTLGRSKENDIRMNASQVSSNHAVLRFDGGNWSIDDCGSRNGTFVNERLVRSATLSEGSCIFIGGWKLVLAGNTLRFRDTAGPTVVSLRLPVVMEGRAVSAGAADAPYPLFQRSPRLRPAIDNPEIEVLSPPSTGSKPSVSWFSVLLPPILMMSAMGIVSILRGPGMLVFTVPMSIASIIIAVVNYRSQMKKWAQTRALATEKYEAYLKDQDAAITESETRFLLAGSTVHPGPRECVNIAESRERRLWERVTTDGDFLEIRVGSGRIPSNVTIKTPHMQLSLEEDPLLKDAEALKKKHEFLMGFPVTHNFMKSTVTGLVGSRSAIRSAAWTILTGVAAHHAYEDVKIVCIYPESERRAWEWARWLPHVWDAERSRRYLACRGEDARNLIREMSETLKTRRRESGEDRAGTDVQKPVYFMLFADKTLMEDAGGQFGNILPESSKLGMTAVYAYGGIETLPGECQAIVECCESSGVIRLKLEGRDIPYLADRVSLDLMESFARGLAPVRMRSTSSSASIPSSVTFLEGFGVNRVEEIDIMNRWSSACPFRSIAAPIGIRENGEVFEFDIHEKKHGPHGIVAGTSGSGKSEALTTWILSIALNFHPHDVSFALIDFKGDGLAGILKSLPHVAGVISNVNDAGVIERNIRSLYGEIKRRELVFEATGINNIHKYQETRRGGRGMEPMPYLIVVIDEFAEMKTQFPDQMSEFVSIARTGRSLGVYMVLSMQSPGGVVTGQVEANSRFRICLRTANSGESKEILGTADAYQIRHPGRAYVKVGTEVYEQVQTFYSKALYRPDTAAKGPPTKINIVEVNGGRIRPEVYEKTLRLSDAAAEEEGRAVSRYINDTAAKNGISHTRQVWTELLPERLFLSALIAGKEALRDGVWEVRNEGLSVVAGLADDPDGQRQYPFTLDFMRDGHQILYGAPSTGKTTFLQTVITSAAMMYTPEQLQFLVLDFGTWGLKIFERLPHTLLAVDANDADNVKRAEKFMLAEIERRKRIFSEEGVGTLEAYREVTGRCYPAIVIVIDNIASLYNMYQDMLDSLITVAREGGSIGVYLLVTAGNPGSFMFRIAQYVKAAYALQLTDKSDYRALVGGSGRIEPGRFPGRGFAKGPFEFQTALCVDSATDGARVKQLRAMCDAMSEAWQGPSPNLNRLSPDTIDADTLSFDANSVQIGLDKDTAEPYTFVFADMNGCVITGPPSSGKTNLLGLLVRALASDGDTELCIYEKETVLEGMCGNAAAECKIARDGGTFDEMMPGLAALFDRRADGADTVPRVAICIDDFIQFYREISDESAETLARIVSYGEEYGIYIYITGETEGITYLHNNFVKAFESCLAYGNAIALGERLKSLAVFDKLHQAGEDLTAGGHEGFVIHGGNVKLIKTAGIKIAEAVTAGV